MRRNTIDRIHDGKATKDEKVAGFLDCFDDMTRMAAIPEASFIQTNAIDDRLADI